jgi:hypothetical protein
VIPPRALGWRSNGNVASHPSLALRYNPAMTELRIGTSAFTANGWQGSFYPSGMKPRDYLTYYATKFNIVEIDSTFYRTPSRSTVTGWPDKTPEGFLIAALLT